MSSNNRYAMNSILTHIKNCALNQSVSPECAQQMKCNSATTVRYHWDDVINLHNTAFID